MQPSILFLIDIMRWRGGTEIHLFELATRLEAYGYHPIVCNLGGEEPVLTQLAEAGVETWPRELIRLYMPEGRSVARSVAREAASRNVQVVHTFHFKSDWMGPSVARRLGCPLVSSRRDLGFHRTTVHNLVYRMVRPRVAAFIAPSEAVRQVMIRQDRLDPERVHVIYNGLDRARFEGNHDRAAARKAMGLPVNGPVIGMVSGFRPIKDHPTLLKAMQCIVRDHPNAHLALVGEGTEEAKLRDMTAELGLTNNVTFTGPTRDVPRALAAMDIFVLSTHSEGMSNAIIEAMAAGLPVVASDVGGNAECVANGVTGFIVPHEDVDALAARLTELLCDTAESAAFGEAGRQRVAELFDVEAMVRRTAELYRALTPGMMPDAV